MPLETWKNLSVDYFIRKGLWVTPIFCVNCFLHDQKKKKKANGNGKTEGKRPKPDHYPAYANAGSTWKYSTYTPLARFECGVHLKGGSVIRRVGCTTGRMTNFFIRAAAAAPQFSYELENDDFRRTKQFGTRWQLLHRFLLNWIGMMTTISNLLQRWLHFTAFMKLKLKLKSFGFPGSTHIDSSHRWIYPDSFSFTFLSATWEDCQKMLSLGSFGSFGSSGPTAPQGFGIFSSGLRWFCGKFIADI